MDDKKKDLIGRDEFNLIEVPFTVLSSRATNIKKLEFEDKQNDIIRHWTIKGSDEFGFPCAADEEIYIAMIYLTQMTNFENCKVLFNPYELLNLMNWCTDGHQYKRLELALCRLVEMTIYTDYLWDKGEFKSYKKSSFHIINEFVIDKGKKNKKNSYFIWGETIFESLCSGNIKSLDIGTYFNLKTATSKRFYRIWDKRTYKKNEITFDLFELCHEKLGISRAIIHPSLLKKILNPALKEQKEKKLLSAAEYRKNKNKQWVLTIKKYEKEKTKHKEEDKSEDNSLLSKLLSLKIPQNCAEKLIKDCDDINIIWDWINALEVLKPQNKAGFLITALREKWDIPEHLKKKKVEKEKKGEEKLREEYQKNIFKQVDEWIKKNMKKEQFEKEIMSHREIFLTKYPFYKQFKDSIFLNPFVENNYKKMKAEELELSSFEVWKEKSCF